MRRPFGINYREWALILLMFGFFLLIVWVSFW